MGTTSKLLCLITNIGELRVNCIGMYYDLQVWFNSDSIANILSFSSIAEKYRIVIDIAKDKDILIEIEDGKWIKFAKNKLGLYMHNVRKEFSTYSNNNIKNTLISYSLL